jgi:hypothetical protein
MKTTSRWRLALGAGVLCLGATRVFAVEPDAGVNSPVVEVSYRNPGGFIDTDPDLSQRNDWLEELRRYVVQRASRSVSADTRLVVMITDVQRAGMVKPWRRTADGYLRFVRDATPPRIDLVFQLISPQGAVLKEGTRHLRDINFLGSITFHTGEPLAYEKNLIDDWLRQDFGAPQP